MTSITSPNLLARTSAIDFLLAIVTVSYPQGHELVMAAFKHDPTQLPFQGLVSSVAQLVEGKGILGSTVGSKREGWEDFMAASVNGRDGGEMQRNINDFLVKIPKIISAFNLILTFFPHSTPLCIRT